MQQHNDLGRIIAGEERKSGNGLNEEPEQTSRGGNGMQKKKEGGDHSGKSEG